MLGGDLRGRRIGGRGLNCLPVLPCGRLVGCLGGNCGRSRSCRLPVSSSGYLVSPLGVCGGDLVCPLRVLAGGGDLVGGLGDLRRGRGLSRPLRILRSLSRIGCPLRILRGSRSLEGRPLWVLRRRSLVCRSLGVLRRCRSLVCSLGILLDGSLTRSNLVCPLCICLIRNLRRSLVCSLGILDGRLRLRRDSSLGLSWGGSLDRRGGAGRRIGDGFRDVPLFAYPLPIPTQKLSRGYPEALPGEDFRDRERHEDPGSPDEPEKPWEGLQQDELHHRDDGEPREQYGANHTGRIGAPAFPELHIGDLDYPRHDPQNHQGAREHRELGEHHGGQRHREGEDRHVRVEGMLLGWSRCYPHDLEHHLRESAGMPLLLPFADAQQDRCDDGDLLEGQQSGPVLGSPQHYPDDVDGEDVDAVLLQDFLHVAPLPPLGKRLSPQIQFKEGGAVAGIGGRRRGVSPGSPDCLLVGHEILERGVLQDVVHPRIVSDGLDVDLGRGHEHAVHEPEHETELRIDSEILVV